MMIKKLKTYMATLFLAATMLLSGLAVPILGATVSAVTPGEAACESANKAADSKQNCGKTDPNQVSNGVAKIGKSIVNVFSAIIGVTAVIFLLYGGFRYITSGGSTEKVGDAKKTIIFAIIGLIVVALAQVIVNLTLSTTAGQVKDANL
jgi:hypothetical protein